MGELPGIIFVIIIAATIFIVLCHKQSKKELDGHHAFEQKSAHIVPFTESVMQIYTIYAKPVKAIAKLGV